MKKMIALSMLTALAVVGSAQAKDMFQWNGGDLTLETGGGFWGVTNDEDTVQLMAMKDVYIEAQLVEDGQRSGEITGSAELMKGDRLLQRYSNAGSGKHWRLLFFVEGEKVDGRKAVRANESKEKAEFEPLNMKK